jgi:hypothetical protein
MSAGNTRLTRHDRWAIALVAVGGVAVPVIGWIIGELLLWTSPRWSARQKVGATLLLPGGLVPAALALTGGIGSYSEVCGGPVDQPQMCTGGRAEGYIILGWFATAVLVLVPLATAVVLTRTQRLDTQAADAGALAT